MNKRLALLSVVLMISSIAAAETPEERRRAQYRAKYERLDWIEERIGATRPIRREGPARKANITDEEVREIQAEAVQVEPGAIINISTVVVGCPCEDGPTCSDQVWIVAHRPNKSTGLMLSKMSGHWTIGIVQRWWLDYEKLRSRRNEFHSLTAWLEAEEKLTERFPACSSEKVKAVAQHGPE